MEICSVTYPFFCITRMAPLLLFYLFLIDIPSGFSTVQLANRRHPYLTNASDQEALPGFLSAIPTSVPSQSLRATWKPNVSFCEWKGVICSMRTEQVVSLNVRSMGMGLQDTENSSYEDLLAFYQKSKSSLEMKSVQFRFAGTNMVSKVALGQRLSHFVLVLYEHAVATLMLMLFTFILDKKTRPHFSFSTFSEIFGRIFLGLRVGKSRGGTALLLIMIIAFTSKAAAVTVDNTETIYSANEDIPVGDKLPPSCYYVATCGDCLPCPPKGHGFLCCDGL